MAFSDPNLEKVYQLGKREAIQSIRKKLLLRANHYLKNVDSPDSPIIYWRMQLHSCNGYSVLQILNHHHLGKKGFRCGWDKK